MGLGAHPPGLGAKSPYADELYVAIHVATYVYIAMQLASYMVK